jgi:hypothetical protein
VQTKNINDSDQVKAAKGTFTALKDSDILDYPGKKDGEVVGEIIQEDEVKRLSTVNDIWSQISYKNDEGKKKIGYNAQKIAEFLNAHEKVSHVNYAGLPDDKYYPLAQKYMNGGRTCGVISFELTGGREAAVRFMDSLKLATIATHVAASKTMILHPASHTHRQMNDEQLAEAGVSPGMIRLSVGIENADDIIADIEQALQNA